MNLFFYTLLTSSFKQIFINKINLEDDCFHKANKFTLACYRNQILYKSLMVIASKDYIIILTESILKKKKKQSECHCILPDSDWQ